MMFIVHYEGFAGTKRELEATDVLSHDGLIAFHRVEDGLKTYIPIDRIYRIEQVE